ncbi:MAG: hypothetical protein GY936_15810 [Ignavibacteriae bacterium]|nr:hypothetical protein [Ignavibacteriota bacterium]
MANAIRWGDGVETVNVMKVWETGSEFAGVRMFAPGTIADNGPANAEFGPNIPTTRAVDELANSIPDYTDTKFFVQYTNFGQNDRGEIGRYEAGTTAVIANNKFMVCGVDKYHGHPGGGGNPVFFGEFDDFNVLSTYISNILSLPFFNDWGFGNTPVSTTDRDLLTKQLYDNGMWILRDGFLPPIQVTCLVNYQFDMSDSWSGNTAVNDWNYTSNNNATIVGTNGGLSTDGGKTGELDRTWMGVWRSTTNALSTMRANSTLSPNGFVISYEWVGAQEEGSQSTSRYFFDASNGTGTWCKANDGTYAINWGGGLQIGSSASDSITTKRHHMIMTGNRLNNVSKGYYSDVAGNRSTYSGTCSSAMVNIGSNFKYFTDKNVSSNFFGYMGMFRIWSGELTATQVDICKQHERGRLGISDETPAPPASWEMDDITLNATSGNLPSSMMSTFGGLVVSPYVDSTGVRIYTFDASDQSLNQGSFATANDVTSTVTYVGTSPFGRFSFTPDSYWFKPDGTKLYVLKDAPNSIPILYQATLSTAWDITTMGTLSTSINPSINTYTSAFAINNSGTTLWWVMRTNSTNPQVIKSYKYTLSTAWDISSVGSPTISDVSTTWNTPTGAGPIGNGAFYNNVLDTSSTDVIIISGAGEGFAFEDDVTNSDFNSNAEKSESGLNSSDTTYGYSMERFGTSFNYTFKVSQYALNFPS